ncbi:double-strand break repair helicase AddA [Thalassobaculum salexigens]|uniref:double-strand break repair helicase AddA n=1 Tax=Thalassobaculum salexigens TaxID=455360 RepID=UPI00248E7702|nr:double-strand break repair helicase AddA [Thalassobaculum salexigens]
MSTLDPLSAPAGNAIEEATRNQREAADPSVSAWVAASAGSGKTKVLTDRVLNLLLAGTKPQRLLCLTFTKAAAAEMATRLSRTLAKWTVLDADALGKELETLDGRVASQDRMAKARRLFAEVLDAPGGLKIQTIHAFAQSLLGRFPLEAGVPPNFRLADDRAAATLLEDAERSVLERARGGADGDLADALAVVTDRAAEQTVRDLLKTMLVQRTRLTRSLEAAAGIGAITARLHATLGTDPADTDWILRRAASDDDAFDRDALHAAASALAAGGKTDTNRADTLFAWLALPDADARANAWDDYKRALLTQEGAIQARLATKGVQERAPTLLDDLTREAERILGLEERRKALDTALRSAALIRLSAAIIDAYGRAKSRRALLDFEDLVERARRLLTSPGTAAWVLFKLDEGLEHILIDEAQDTSPAQWEIVRALAEEFFAGLGAMAERAPDRPRTIFAVGDVKQSIYSFQGADPAGFTEAREYFAGRVTAAEQTFRDVQMQVSFRSTAAVLSAVDAVFAREDARQGVAEIVAGVTREIAHRASRTGQAGRVELWPVVEPEDEEAGDPWSPPLTRASMDAPVTRLAQTIAGRIAGWIAAGEPLEAKNRPIRPGDVMVLVRRRGAFVAELVRALKAAGVPVAGVDRMVLTEQMAVRDLIALGEALLLPDDDLTLATVLKSPLVGLSEEDLLDLAQGRKERRLWAELWRRAEERDVFARAARRLSRWSGMARNLPPHAFYQQILSAERGRERLVARLGPDCEDAIDEFLAQALDDERENPPSLQSFLHAVVAGEQEVKRELEGGEVDQVRVMTVHGAKGLQAPIVILPDTVRPPQLRDAVVWHGDGLDLPLWAPSSASADAVSAGARAKAREAMEQEYRRLLYVAMTRAEDRLIVCGWKGKRDPVDKGWFGHARAGLPAIAAQDEDGTLVLATPQEAAAPAARAGTAAPAPASLPGWAGSAAPREPTPPRPLAPSRPAADEPPVRSPLQRDGTDPFKRGVLLHRLLQLLPDMEPTRRHEAGRALLTRPVHALSPDQVESWLAEVLAVLDDPEFAPVFAPGSRAEVPIVGQVTGPEGLQIVSGRIDRLAVGPDAVLIVDYKTNRPPPSSIDAVADTYMRQMSTYRSLVASLYPGRAVRCALLWTDGPTLMPIPDPLLQGFGALP